MYILSSAQIRQWDVFTIKNEPVSSIDLMERAAAACLNWLQTHHYLSHPFVIFCGKGNNGGDGLSLARMLRAKQHIVTVYMLETGQAGTPDFEVNLQRLKNTGVEIISIEREEQFPSVSFNTIIIEALFGTGLSRPLEDMPGKLVEYINRLANEVIAIDMPGGLFADERSGGNAIIKAAHTLSFQCYKLALLMPENEQYFGRVNILNIGLLPDYLNAIDTVYEYIDESVITTIYKPRKAFSHKGSFGHALIIAGSYGKMGAAVLAAKACLRTGSGLLSCMVPGCGYTIMQISVPEAMVITDGNEHTISSFAADLLKHDAIGIGPGLGTAKETQEAFRQIIKSNNKPVVIDADGLNILSLNPELLADIPHASVLTPHPKEFDRLFGNSADDFERLKLAIEKAGELKLIIVLKGHHTAIAVPSGKCYFNSTGNAGMATGGSGDVLTGILTSLLAQGYETEQAAILGVYLHGLSGDFAALHKSEEALIASDITDYLPEAFKKISVPGKRSPDFITD